MTTSSMRAASRSTTSPILHWSASSKIRSSTSTTWRRPWSGATTASATAAFTASRSLRRSLAMLSLRSRSSATRPRPAGASLQSSLLQLTRSQKNRPLWQGHTFGSLMSRSLSESSVSGGPAPTGTATMPLGLSGSSVALGGSERRNELQLAATKHAQTSQTEIAAPPDAHVVVILQSLQHRAPAPAHHFGLPIGDAHRGKHDRQDGCDAERRTQAGDGREHHSADGSRSNRRDAEEDHFGGRRRWSHRGTDDASGPSEGQRAQQADHFVLIKRELQSRELELQLSVGAHIKERDGASPGGPKTTGKASHKVCIATSTESLARDQASGGGRSSGGAVDAAGSTSRATAPEVPHPQASSSRCNLRT